MTLQDIFDYVRANPQWASFYFIIIPIIVLLFGWICTGNGDLSPWKYIFSCLIYLVSVPGIFALTLNIYLFLFERQSVFNANIILQYLPILSMVSSLLIMKRFVDLNAIPGFRKLSGLLMVIFITISFMWILDKTHIYAIAFISFPQLIIMFAVLFLAVRFGWYMLFKQQNPTN